MLRSGSAFFNALFKSNMIETSKKRIVLHDCTPEEWKVISSFFQPPSITNHPLDNICVSNVEMLIPWFDKVQAHTLLARCDKVYCIKVFATRRRLGNRRGAPVGSLPSLLAKTLKEDLCYLLDALEFSVKHTLPQTMAQCCSEGVRLIKESPDILSGSAIMQFFRLCLHHKTCCDAFWSPLRRLLPGPILNEERMAHGPPPALHDPDYDWAFSAIVELSFQAHLREIFSRQANTAKATR